MSEIANRSDDRSVPRIGRDWSVSRSSPQATISERTRVGIELYAPLAVYLFGIIRVVTTKSDQSSRRLPNRILLASIVSVR
jgi:hypothetical protein